MKKAENLKKLNIRKKPFFIVISMILFIAVGGSFAWYLLSGQKHEADTKDLAIMSPYFLYLLNPDDSSSLQFSVGNIHPGEVKQVVICVSNKKPTGSDEDVIDIAKESDFEYDLEFIYTENLALDYEVYELSKKAIPEDGTSIPDGSIKIEGVDYFYWTKKSVTDTGDNGTTTSSVKSLEGVDVSKTRWEAVFGTDANTSSIQNIGQYFLFEKDINGTALHLTYTYEDNKPKYEYDYYLIEMSWREGADFSVNAKETDLLYVVVNAKQPEPQLQTETQTVE